MRIIDIKRNRKWLNCEVYIDNISPPEETQFDGFVQSIDVTFAQGMKDVMNYYFTEPIFAVDETLVGNQWYDIKWTGEYLKCKPSKSNQDASLDMKANGVDWDKVNLGKCRHGILCAILQAGANPYLIVEESKYQTCINKLADFSMNGEIK